ncbi:MAG: DUF58 domain-containing protein [Alphaproteobacteria bacterium]|nr:DUF58 domain-containing protein [Alphaproteobacteria bacterium]
MSVNPVLLELPDLVSLKEQAESLVLPTNDKVSLTGFGDKKSPFRSRGLDFQEVRVYQPGDDIRQIDWRVTAKYGEPFTKLYTEEKEQQIYLVCDLRPNMQFASHGHFKSVMAGRLTALSAFMAAKKKDKLAYTLLTDKIISSIDAASSDLIPTLLNQLTIKPTEDSDISFSDAISHLGRHLKTGASLILFSDFYDITEKELKYLGQLGQKNTVTFVHIYDEMERKLPLESLPYSDGKNTFVMDGKDAQKTFQKSWDEQTNILRQAIQRYGLGYLTLSTNGQYLNLYTQFCWGDK